MFREYFKVLSLVQSKFDIESIDIKLSPLKCFLLVLKGKKKLLVTNELNTLKVKKFPVFNAVLALQQIKDDEECSRFMHVNWFKARVE
jgi:hypothetical protein